MTTAERLVVRDTAQVMGTVFSFCMTAPAGMRRVEVRRALVAAVDELRAIDREFSPFREDSLVARVRRGELRPEAYPPRLAEVIDRCAAMRAATDGWFDAWAVPGGFDPSGLVKGWAIERAAERVAAAGISDFAINGGGDILVRGTAPHGEPWRVGIRNPRDPRSVVMVLAMTGGAVATSGGYERGQHVVNPHTGEPTSGVLSDAPSPEGLTVASATVTGPDLGTADAYATALYAAGQPGLSWFPTPDGCEALTVADDLTGTYTQGFARLRAVGPA